MEFKSLFNGVAMGFMGLLLGAQVSLASLTSEQRVSDFQEMVSIIDRNYGPLHWKKSTIGLDWKARVEEFRSKIAATKSDAEFYRVMAQFLNILQDAHVRVIAPTNYFSSLGFLCDYVEGKVLINKIDALKLPRQLFPFKKGDQLLAIGDVPVERLMLDLAQFSATGNEATTKRIAAVTLTYRQESIGLVVPRGLTTVTVLPRGASTPITVMATWITKGIPLLELDDLAHANLVKSDYFDIPKSKAKTKTGKELMQSISEMSLFNLGLSKRYKEDLIRMGVEELGNPISMFELPVGSINLGAPLTAAVYQAAGKRIGILRVPTFEDPNVIQVLAQAIVIMERETDVLVLDQTNNPGGQAQLISGLASMFADKSFKDIRFELRPSLAWLERFRGFNDEVDAVLAKDPNDVVANALQARFTYLEEEVRDALKEKRFLTRPISLDIKGGNGMIQPQVSVRYTKPVLMLINELDISAADAFPTVLKDNGRVTLFGAAAAGAGGNVKEHGPLANSYLKFNLTESLFVRPNGQYVENRGVKPDIEYQVTEEDFMNGYKKYTRAFTIEALKLVGVTQAQFEAFEIAEKNRPAPAAAPSPSGMLVIGK